MANLPYNVAVPVLLHLLATFDSIERVLVMVQLEVADRLAAEPGSRVYGMPSVKAAWYADVRRAGVIGRNVFWPAPNVDSGSGRDDAAQPTGERGGPRAGLRGRRCRLLATPQDDSRPHCRALSARARRPSERITAAGLDPTARGERLSVEDFARLADALA